MTMKRYFLKPLKKEELVRFFDERASKVIDDLLLTATYFQPPVISEGQVLPVHIPKEHIEQFIVQAIGASPCGAGSYPVDVMDKERGFGADVKMLSCKQRDGRLLSADSGETSLAQKFSEENLDRYFNQGKFEEIKDIWVSILNEKYEKVFIEGIKDLYYFFILRAGKEFFLTGCKLDMTQVTNISVLNTSSSSVFLDGVIPEKFGKSKIYKAKKRLELRLVPSGWQDGYSIKFSEKAFEDIVNLRSLNNKEYLYYWEKRSDGFKKAIISNQ